MKLILIIVLAALNSYSWAQQRQAVSSKFADSLSVYDKSLSRKAMKSDLRIFRDIREKMNPGFYRYRTRKQMDSIYKWANNEIKKPLSTTGFYKIILQLSNFEGSCHNYTEVPSDLLAFLNRQRAFFPYSLKYIEGRMLFNNANAPIPVGASIISINGVRDTAIMHSFYKYVTTDGYTVTEKLSSSVNIKFGLRYILEYGLKDSFVVAYLTHDSNEVKTVTVPAVSSDEREKNLSVRHSILVDSAIDFDKQPSYSFRRVNDSTAQINLRIFTMATGADDPEFKIYTRFIDSVFADLQREKIPNLIIDVRGNPGGSDPTFEQPVMYLSDHSFKENTMAYIIFEHFAYEQYFFGVSTAVKMDSAAKEEGKKMIKDQFTLLEDGKNIQTPKYNPVYYPKQPAFKGKLYLLIDEAVASAGSHFASLVKAYARNSTIVGVETNGGYYEHTGHIPAVYQLPNSRIKTKFSIVQVVQDAVKKPDQPEGRGIIPDHEVWQSYDDFMQNRDGQMEYVLKLIEGRIRKEK